jgi:hypothetical protein
MKKMLIHKLSIPLTHTTPINHNEIQLPKIIHGKDLP